MDIIFDLFLYFFSVFGQDVLLGDASKARNQFGWKPTVSFKVVFCIYLMQLIYLSYLSNPLSPKNHI